MRKVMLNKQALTGYTIYQTCPVGTVLDFAGISVPNGFMPCDGRALSRTEYKELYEVIGTIYGEGNGSTTFNIPNTFEKVIEGASASTLGKNYEAGIPNITGTYVGGNIYTGAFGAGTNAENNGFTTTSHSDLRIHSFNAKNGETKTDGTLKANTDKKVYGNSNTVQMDAIGMYKIIKVKSYMLDNPEARSETPVYEVPIGTILPSGCTTAPVGYLICNGQEVSRTVYSELFDAIGTTYGEGDGVETFNIPDGRKRVFEGGDTGLGAYIEAGLPNITGAISSPAKWQNNGHQSGSGAFYNNSGISQCSGFSGNDTGGSAINFSASRSNDIYGNSDTVQMDAFTGNYIIKAVKTTGEPSSDVEIDDTKFTTANVLSASKTKELTKQVYSTEEQVVGTWIDGKPIYQKSFSGYFASGSILVENVDSVIESMGSYEYVTNKWVALNYIDSGGKGYIYRIDDNTIRFYGNKTGGLKATVKYTKTTD